ncbi:hypothetical protein TKK_0008716 [Trichogramma kaykai]
MNNDLGKEISPVSGASPSPVVASSTGDACGPRHLPTFTSTFVDTTTMDTSATSLSSIPGHELSGLNMGLHSWEYFEGLGGRLIDARGEVVMASQYRPWESKGHHAVPADGLPSFQSQFSGVGGPTDIGQEPQLTTLTPLSPASMSHSPPMSLPSFHTLGSAPPTHRVPQPPHGYPLVPAAVPARDVIQQQIVDERNIQLLGTPSPLQPFGPPPVSQHHPPPPPPPIGVGAPPPQHPMGVVKPEPYPQLHHANFQNPMSTVLDSSPSTRVDGRKKDRRKGNRASSLESEDSGGPIGSESSGQVAAVSSTGRGGHHGLGGGMNDGDDGGLGDKPAKKKRKRCGECIGCQRKDNCGECAPCRNDKSHQICKMRRCEKLTEKKGILP